MLLPAFFAFTGMRTEIGLVSGLSQWLWVLAIIGVATLGKFGGPTLAARVTGIGWRDASALGILMNMRGLMELVVLNIGLDMKVISPTLFAMLVLMVLATTVATTPGLALLRISDSRCDGGELIRRGGEMSPAAARDAVIAQQLEPLALVGFGLGTFEGNAVQFPLNQRRHRDATQAGDWTGTNTKPCCGAGRGVCVTGRSQKGPNRRIRLCGMAQAQVQNLIGFKAID